MKRNKIIAICVIILLVFLHYFHWHWTRALVIVVNFSGEEINNVSVGVKSMSYNFDRIFNGNSKTMQFSPYSFIGSDIKLSFELNGKKKEWQGGYIESSGGYTIVLKIGSDGTVKSYFENFLRISKMPHDKIIILPPYGRGDYVDPGPVADECNSKKDGYGLNSTFIKQCELIESRVGFSNKECPNGFSAQGCSICKFKCHFKSGI